MLYNPFLVLFWDFWIWAHAFLPSFLHQMNTDHPQWANGEQEACGPWHPGIHGLLGRQPNKLQITTMRSVLRKRSSSYENWWARRKAFHRWNWGRGEWDASGRTWGCFLRGEGRCCVTVYQGSYGRNLLMNWRLGKITSEPFPSLRHSDSVSRINQEGKEQCDL